MELFHQLHENITFIDDSKATNVASSLEGLKSIDESKSLIVICGGRSKNQDFKNFTDYLNKRAKQIYFFGESTKILKELFDSSKSQAVSNLEEAVHSALKIIESDAVLILSPACSSLDMFESFEERGKKFKDLVLNAKI
jgi:UDP-N-acetylmuramoylalanine--D-glutamate ligase